MVDLHAVSMSDDALSEDRASSPSVETLVRKNIILQKFIETFETLPELWDATCPSYKNKYKRREALDRLLVYCKQWKPDASREDVRNKINSLRSNFRKELKKIELSKRPGIGTDDNYKPKNWTFKALQFLHTAERDNKSNNLHPAPSDETNANNQNITNRYTELESSVASSSGFSSINHDDIIPPRPKKKKDIAEKPTEVLDRARELLPQSYSQSSMDVDPLALVWTQKLKTLNSTQRIFAEKGINDILFEAQLNNLQRDSIKMNVQPTSISQCSNTIPSPAENTYTSTRPPQIHISETDNLQYSNQVKSEKGPNLVFIKREPNSKD